MEIKATIEFLSPIHVGSGETITPFEYFLKESKLHKVNFNKLFSTLSEENMKTLIDALDRNHFVKLRSFAEEHATTETIEYSISVSKAVAKEYFKKKESNENRLEIHMFPISGVSPHPYLPGSSIKGALRTAILNQLVQKEDPQIIKQWIHETNRDNTGNQFEGKILKTNGNIRADIFRVLKVFDVPLSSEDTEIVKCSNFTLKRNSEIPMCFQVTKSKISGIQGSWKKDLTLVWDEALEKSRIQYKQDKNKVVEEDLFRKKFTLQDLGNACNEFYFKVLYWELDQFYKHETAPIFSILKELHSKIEKNQFLIRLGRFGHVESKTFDKYRQPRARKGWGKSRTKANETYPMGWAVITIPNMEFSKPTEDELKKWIPSPNKENNSSTTQKPNNPKPQHKSEQHSSSSHSPKPSNNPKQFSKQQDFSKKAQEKNQSGYNPFRDAFTKKDKK